MNKQLLEKFGKGMKPIPATRVWSRSLKGFPDKVEARGFILVNDNTKKVTYVNIYRGKAGKNWDSDKSTFDFKPEVLNKKLSGGEYSETNIQGCPITTEAESPTTETTDQQSVAASQTAQTTQTT